MTEFGRTFGWHDFRQYDLDASFPAAALEHSKSSFFTQAKRITDLAGGRGWSLRQTMGHQRYQFTSPFVGSAVTVADEIQRWFEGRAFDEINVHAGHPSQFQRFTEEVVPLLQARGLFRDEYASSWRIEWGAEQTDFDPGVVRSAVRRSDQVGKALFARTGVR